MSIIFKNKKGLGRGLSSLIGDTKTASKNNAGPQSWFFFWEMSSFMLFSHKKIIFNFLAKNRKSELHIKDDLIEGEYEDKDSENDKKL